MKLFSAASAVLLLALILILGSCKEANNVANGNSHLFLTADPPAISFNGTSTLTVSGTDENGNILPDGTVVSFKVNEAGRVNPSSVRLVGGTATSTYFATNFSGDITVTATSGSVEATTIINVSDNIKRNVFVSANPANFPTGGGTSLLSAVVTDGSGKPIQDIGVQFSTTEGSLQSNGAFIQTNSNGVVNDVLNTTMTATVTATTDDGFSGQITIPVGIGRIVCHMSVSTSNPKVGQSVQFFDTSDDPSMQIVRYHWDFGNGASADGKNVIQSFSTAGTFNVVHSVIDGQGNTDFCDPFPIQVSQ
jgi:hypothetical protein